MEIWKGTGGKGERDMERGQGDRGKAAKRGGGNEGRLTNTFWTLATKKRFFFLYFFLSQSKFSGSKFRYLGSVTLGIVTLYLACKRLVRECHKCLNKAFPI